MMPEIMPTAVVFDVGNVLVDWNVRAFYAPLIPDPARLDWFLAEVVTPQWHFQHDAGRAFAETSAELIARFPAEADLIRLYGPRFNETVPGPVPGMIELGEDICLKAVRRGVPRYSSALSDMVSHPRAATVMGLLEEARMARLRGFRVAQKNGSMKTAMGRVKDWFVGNF